jgi:hypothetical protein
MQAGKNLPQKGFGDPLSTPAKKPVVMIPVILLFVVFVVLWWFDSPVAFW